MCNTSKKITGRKLWCAFPWLALFFRSSAGWKVTHWIQKGLFWQIRISFSVLCIYFCSLWSSVQNRPFLLFLQLYGFKLKNIELPKKKRWKAWELTRKKKRVVFWSTFICRMFYCPPFLPVDQILPLDMCTVAQKLRNCSQAEFGPPNYFYIWRPLIAWQLFMPPEFKNFGVNW